MKAKDLRIDSIYDSVRWKQPVKLQLSDLNELYYRCYGAALDSEIIAEMFKPIELTEEWLIKLELIKQRDKPNDKYIWLFSFAGDFDCYFNVFGRNEICIEQYSEGALELEHIKYVHQLQNLYFALTGKELEIR